MDRRLGTTPFVVIICFLLSLAAHPARAGAQHLTNMDFESGADADGIPTGWGDTSMQPATGGSGYRIALDTTVAHSGRASARIHFRGPRGGPQPFGTITRGFAADAYRGKRVQLSGYILTLDVTGVGAQIWIRVDDAFGVLADDSMTDRPVTGNTEWTRYSCVLDVSSKAAMIVIGASLEGEGTMWVDDMAIEEVGEDVPTTAEVYVVDRDPRTEEVAWLGAHTHTIDTPEAGNGFEDLQPLRDMVGTARIVGLGEGTHGTREFFQMKHRLLEFLATEMGFTIFSIEASTPEAYRLNDYVLGGDGDPAALIGGMYFWTWNTEEVLAMVEWMRAFNASGKGRVEFTGFDMQTPSVAMQIVRGFLDDADAELAATANDTYDAISASTRKGGGGFGVATWKFPVDDARGKQVRFSGYIKTEGVKNGRAGLWWRVDSDAGRAIAFDNMQSRGPRGTTDWKRYEVVLDVADDATNINFGALMPGEGRAWFDSLAVELDGVPYSPPKDFDFDFEASTDGYYTSDGTSYRVALTHDEARSGVQSLLVEKLGEPPAAAPSPQDLSDRAHDIFENMTAARPRYIETAPEHDVDWAIHNARIVDQCMRLKANPRSTVRDESMAENISWILDQNPGAKVVLWAHNGHIQRGEGHMGHYLDEAYGNNYVPVGFATSDGTYVAWSESGLKTGDLVAPPPGSVESFFVGTGAEAVFVDLRGHAGEPDAGWLKEPRLFRQIGAGVTNFQFYPAAVAERFDILIYLRSTTAAVQLKKGSK